MPQAEGARTVTVERERGAAPAPAQATAPAIPRIRDPRRAAVSGDGFGRGFRTGLLLSLAVHAALGALFARDLLSGRTAEPRPLLVTTGLEVGPLLDPDPEPLEVTPPEVPRLEVPPADLQEDLPDLADPRMAPSPEPPGPPAAIIGVQSLEGRRRGVPGGRGGGGGGGGTDRAPPVPVEGAALPGAAPPPPSPEPLFASARLLSDAAPVYPARAREAGQEGSVYLRIEVSPEGKVAGVAVEKSSGIRSLDEAAVRAAGAWTFEPATEDGRPVASTVHRRVNFHL